MAPLLTLQLLSKWTALLKNLLIFLLILVGALSYKKKKRTLKVSVVAVVLIFILRKFCLFIFLCSAAGSITIHDKCVHALKI